MSEDGMSQEERRQYKKETGKFPLYADLPTEDYKKWLEMKDMQDAIKKVIEEERSK